MENRSGGSIALELGGVFDLFGKIRLAEGQHAARGEKDVIGFALNKDLAAVSLGPFDVVTR